MTSPSDRGAAGHRALLFLGLSVLAGALVAGLALPAVGLIGLTAKRGAENFQSLPAALEVPPLKQRSVLLAADGTKIATFYSQNRVFVPIDKVSQEMKDAIVATEDARFYEHNGIDLQGTIRALVANSQAGGVTQGGSTITQQYVKNILIASARTKEEREAASEDSVARKIQELRYALGLEEEWTKDQILEGYLNIAYFGGQAYGVEVAARRYFSKPASELNAGEAATIAGIVKYPTAYDPLENPRESRDRRDFVLQRMYDEGMITDKQLDRFQGRSMARLLKPSDLTRGCGVSKVPFFCEYVQLAFLDDPAYGKTRADRRALLNSGGLTIRTTLDLDDQKSAQNAVETYLPTGDPSGRVAAIAMVEPGTGNVRAMAQNLKYGKGEDASFINNAVDAKYSGTNGQQPGSTFKIFTVAAAIEQGLPMNESIYSPDTMTMPYGSYENCEGTTVPEWPNFGNYEGADPGNYTMYTGTALSINTYFSQLAERAGLCNVWDAASRAGVTDALTGEAPVDNLEYQYAPGVIGGGALNMSPLTLAESYATFAARGLHCEPRVITAVRALDGSEIRVPKPQCEQVFEPEVADAVNDVMAGVLSEGGTAEEMYLDRPSAGKTGTTDDYNAIWFAGYTPDLAAAIWAGSPESPVENPMKFITINGQYWDYWYGSRLPGPIWRDAMLGALADVPPSSFTPMDPSFIDGDTLTVPSLSGLTEKAAVAKLESLDLNPEVADYTVASYSAAGTVSYTSPGTGYEVSPGTTVTIYLSSGTPPTPTPTPTPSKSDKPSPSPSPSESGGNGNTNPDSNPNPGNGGDNGNAGGNGNN